VLLTLLVVSPRVPPGLLTRAGWQAVEAAEQVAATDGATVDALRRTGLRAELVETPEQLFALPTTGRVALLVSAEVVDSFRAAAPDSEVLEGSPDVPGARLLDLVGVMDRLRVECPWDREQTHRSLATYLLEETYETLEAIESGDTVHLEEELGDLLLQVFFHARIAAEAGAQGFDIDDVAGGIVDKLVHRHPHVFAGLPVEGAAEVERNWEALKAVEKRRTSPLDGIPPALPALAYADKVVGRLARAGVPAGLGDAPGPGGAPAPELGERLLELVVAAREAGLDPEQELRAAVRRLIARASLDGGSRGAV
jgi:XTP/dITP diphosphohydrolase